MPVMKAQDVQRTRQSAVVMDLSDLEREAGLIVSRAKEQAEQIVADAVKAAGAESAKLREAGRLAGHAEGYEAGMAQGLKEGHDQAVAAVSARLAELLDRWGKTLDILQQNMPAHVADARSDMVKLSLAIAEKVTHQTALRDKTVAQATMEDTLALIGSARKVVMHVHPEEEALLQDYLPDLLAKMRTIESVELVSDETVGVGGCVAKFGSGEVDSQLQAQLDRIANELLGQE
jgi:flagellar biosynthesis/type III secretory pathway protein FliH